MAKGRRPLTNEKRLIEWLKQHAYTDREEGTFTKVSVRPISPQKKVGDEIQLLTVPPKTEREADWEVTFTAHILSILEDEAGQLPGMQHFACLAVYSGSETPIGRCIVSLSGSESADADVSDDGILSESADAKGLCGMLMRHLEATQRIGQMERVGLTDSLRRQNERLSTMNEKLLESRWSLLEQVSEMLDHKAERDLENRKATVQANAVEEGIGMARTLVPVVVNKIIGAKVLPETMSGIAVVGKSFFHSLTKEQMGTILGAMTDEQRIQFFSLAETLTEASEGKSNSANGERTQTE